MTVIVIGRICQVILIYGRVILLAVVAKVRKIHLLSINFMCDLEMALVHITHNESLVLHE